MFMFVLWYCCILLCLNVFHFVLSIHYLDSAFISPFGLFFQNAYIFWGKLRGPSVDRLNYENVPYLINYEHEIAT